MSSVLAMADSSVYPMRVALRFEREGRTLARYCYEVTSPAEAREVEDDARQRLWRELGRFGVISHLRRHREEGVADQVGVLRRFPEGWAVDADGGAGCRD
ncbi:MAG: hypothetical protein K2X11_02615 [Acetobacteraceae bacterium]|nr:hypothetical protein [Acetobacteraceae bacterium]